MAGLQEAQLDETTLEWLTDRIVDSIGDALARGEMIAARALQLLLRRYSTGARADLAELLGAALARELDRQARHGCDDDREGWVTLFSEAAAISDDPRLPRAAADLVRGLRARWSGPVKNVGNVETVDDVMRSVEACLLAVNLPEARELAAEAIDALERVVAGAYRPGQGVGYGMT